MTSYFDDLSREIMDAAGDAENSTSYFARRYPTTTEGKVRHQRSAFLDQVEAIEDRTIATISLAIGDREFPDDLRQGILETIAMKRIGGPVGQNPAARSYAWDCKSSELIENLHSLFHRVARRRVETRFGLLSDNPAGIVKRRDAHDTEVRS